MLFYSFTAVDRHPLPWEVTGDIDTPIEWFLFILLLICPPVCVFLSYFIIKFVVWIFPKPFIWIKEGFKEEPPVIEDKE